MGRPEFPCVGTASMNYYNVGRAIQGFVAYLKKRLAVYGERKTETHSMTPPPPPSTTIISAPVILELGCGTGQLSHHLSVALKDTKCTVEATDTGFWFLMPPGNSFEEMKASGIESVTDLFQSPTVGTTSEITIHRMNYIQATQHFQPTICIISWMPKHQDWTKILRHTPSVMEYILIGPAYGGVCGHVFDTWGGDR